MKLFFSFFEKEPDEDEKRQKRKQRRRVASVVIMLMLLVSVYAQPAAAMSFGDFKNAISSGFSNVVDSISSAVHTITDNIEGGIAGALAGAAAGAGVGSVIPGVGTAVGAGIGALVGFFGGIYAEHKLKQSLSTDNTGASLTSSSNATKDDVSKNSDLFKKYHIVDNAQAAASTELYTILAKLATTPTQYSIHMTGSTGNIQLELFGPDEIHGFSAFPVKLRIITSSDPIKQNVIHLKKITMYVINPDTGTAYYTYIKTFANNETSLNGGVYEVTTFLKVPDDYDYDVVQALQSGQITIDLINKLKNAKTKPFEIYIRVDAIKEDWSYVNGTWTHTRDISLSTEAETVSVYKHVTASRDVVLFQTGLNASFPSDMANLVINKFAPFVAEQWGGISNVVIRPYATPVHVADSASTWKFFVAPNHKFLTMFDDHPNIYDDFEVFALRLVQGGSFELADRRPNTLGDMSVDAVKEAYGVIKYNTGPGIVNYRVYGLGLIWIQRDDGTKIPVWILVQPHMSVLDMEKLALDDTRLQRILPIFDDNKITQTELETMKAELDSIKQDIQEKINAAKQLKEMAEANGNEDAAKYADKAIKYYKLELEMLGQAEQTDDAQLALNYLNAARKYEYAGDFEKQAADKANSGDTESASYLHSQAEEYAKTANEYVPTISISGLTDTILSHLTDWKYLLLLAVLVLAGYYVMGRTGALVGLGIWFAIVVGIPALKALVAWLKTKI